jgi:hypothetical protein
MSTSRSTSLCVRSSPRATEPNTRRLRAPYCAYSKDLVTFLLQIHGPGADPRCRRRWAMQSLLRKHACRHCSEVHPRERRATGPAEVSRRRENHALHRENPRGQLSADFHKYGGIRPPMHPASRRCSSVKYSRYSPSSRLARRAPRRPRCVTVFMKGSTMSRMQRVRIVPIGRSSLPAVRSAAMLPARRHDTSRPETFSHAVSAFASALLVVSLDVPVRTVRRRHALAASLHHIPEAAATA